MKPTPTRPQRVHILGVCGTFMAGLALLARELGLQVSGSDRNPYPPMSTQLAAAGIEVLSGYSPEHLDGAAPEVLVGNAMSRGNPAVEALLDRALPYRSGPQWLAEEVLGAHWTLAVAGTHGKTTTSAMLAWILERAGLAPGFLIGGVPLNFERSARLGEGSFFVVEADEYDSAFFDKRSKFVHYRPRTLILNNLEYDHADIFPDLAAIQRQFHHLLRTVPARGLIVCNGREPALDGVLQMGCWTPVERFQDRAGGGWQAEPVAADGSRFAVYCDGSRVGEVRWSQLGRHNISNALAALAAARHVGVPPALGVEALADFAGVKRRLECRGTVGGISVYDDFAHHPTAIATTVQALRHRIDTGQVPGRLLALLELRSNTMRSGVFNDVLCGALSGADRVVLYLDPRLNFALDLGEVCRRPEQALAAVLDWARPGDHILVMSNGGFAGIQDRLLGALAERAG